MSKQRTLWLMSALAAALATAGPAGAQDRTFAFQATQNGQAAGGVSIFTLAGGNKFSQTTPPVAKTDSSGKASMLLSGLLSPDKAHTQLEVSVQVCTNGEKRIFIIPKGSENLLPPDTNDCKKTRIGTIWFDGGPHVTVEFGENPSVTQTGRGTVAGPPPRNPLISMSVGGGLGFNNIGGTSGDRAAFLNSFPGGTFSTSANTFAGDVGSSIGIGPAVFDFNAWRANGGDSKGSGPVLGGGTDTALITQQFQGISLTGGGKIPMGGKASLIIRGGGNFWHANIDTKETVANGTTSSTVTNSRGVDGRGWTAGAALQVDLSRRWSVVFRWDYIPMSNGPVNSHLNEGSVGVMLWVFGLPRK